jgi:hypothetical protein
MNSSILINTHVISWWEFQLVLEGRYLSMCKFLSTNQLGVARREFSTPLFISGSFVGETKYKRWQRLALLITPHSADTLSFDLIDAKQS